MKKFGYATRPSVRSISSTKTIEDEFNDHVIKKEGCWDWKTEGNKNNRYAKIYKKGKGYIGSRVSYEIHKGEIPDGLIICHTCDNPICTNPDHLFLGTKKDNSDDCISKGRHRTTLNIPQVKEIKARLRSGEKYKKISEDYPVGEEIIRRIKNGTAWTHID